MKKVKGEVRPETGHEYKKCFLIFSANFTSDVSHSKKNTAKY